MVEAKTAGEWDAGIHPYDMIYHPRCRDDRKRRLLCCAATRRVVDSAASIQLQRGIEFAEAWADGEFERPAWLAVRKDVRRIRNQTDRSQPRYRIASIVYSLLEREFMSYKMALEECQWATPENNDIDESTHQCQLAKEIFPNPYAEIVFDAAWLKWNDGTVSKLAHAIYDDRHFEDLPVLGDALEEAGCSDPLILNHCRSETEHVRGCWVVDLMTGRDNTHRPIV